MLVKPNAKIRNFSPVEPPKSRSFKEFSRRSKMKPTRSTDIRPQSTVRSRRRVFTP